MSRVEFKGWGLPIPTVALPDPSLSGDLPPITLILPPGDFAKADYVGLGYTHFEVICIGAAGGRGGSLLNGHYGYDYASRYRGGAGGGGGLHKSGGLLADLDDLTPVIVGQAGANGRDNHGPERWLSISDYGDPQFPTERTIVHDTGARPMVRNGVTYINADGSYVGLYTKVDYYGNPVPSNYDVNKHYSDIVLPNAAFTPTLDGQDGGYSSFGDVCMASGGKGGKRAPMFSIGIFVGLTDERYSEYINPANGEPYSMARAADGHPGGDGGDGGIGGTIVAGGGGDGGESIQDYYDLGESGYGNYKGHISTAPKDGTWDGSIGKGGGGGHGGGFRPARYNSSGFLINPELVALAQNGAQGSFNYGDTSMYGPRQNRQGDTNGKLLVPGGGGGAKLGGIQVYGGRSVGAIPDGVVWIRLTKIV